MNVDEYKNKIKAIDDYASINKRNTDKEYALSNNPVKIGDIIRDHSCMIKVEAMRYTRYSSFGFPECVYSGPRLKKNKKPFVSGETEVVYQSNIIK